MSLPTPTPQEGRKHEASASFKGALASLEQATQLGDRLLSSPSPPHQPTDISTAVYPVGSNASSVRSGGAGTPGPDVVEATGEAMLRLAKLCEGLAAGKTGVGGGLGGVGGRGREELAALAVKEYLRAMAVG